MMHETAKHESQTGAALINYQAALFGFIFSQLGNDDAASEVLQETNLAVLKNAARLDDIANFRQWAKTVASFQIKRWRKERLRTAKFVVFDDATADAVARRFASPETARDVDSLALDALAHCIAQLKPGKKKLLHLRYWKGMRVEEIASMQGKDKNSVAVTLHRIRRQLSFCVRGECKPEREIPEAGDELLFEKIFEGMPGTPASNRMDGWIRQSAMHAALALWRTELGLERIAVSRTFRPKLRWLGGFALCAAAGVAFFAVRPRQVTVQGTGPSISEKEEKMKKTAIPIVATLLAANAGAEKFSMLAKDNMNESSFTRANWSDGTTTEAPTAGHDYLVSGGLQMRTPTSGSSTFAGDSLQIGVPGGEKGSFFSSSTTERHSTNLFSAMAK